MNVDILWIVRKELLEILAGSSEGKRLKLNMIVFILVFGVFLPQQFGIQWITTPTGLISLSWLSMYFSSTIVVYAVAGERERHTLETLLASRLSDSAILWGKTCAGLVYGLGFGIMVSVVSLISVNVIFWQGHIQLYSVISCLFFLLFAPALTFLVTHIAALVSIKAKSARQAQQYFMLGMFVLIVPLISLQYLPEWLTARVFAILSETSDVIWGALAVCLMLIANGIVHKITLNRFSRYHLMPGS